MLAFLLVSSLQMSMHDQYAVESFLKRSCMQLFDMKNDFVIEQYTRNGETVHAKAIMNGYEVDLEAVVPEYDEMEMIWASSDNDKEWEYSHPDDAEIETAMAFLKEDIGSFEDPELVRVVLYRTKAEGGITTKQMAVIIDLVGTRTMNKIEYHIDGTENPEFAGAKLL